MRLAAVERPHRFSDKLEGIPLLASAGCEYRPDSFTPSLSICATSALGDASIDDAMSHLSLSQIVGGFDLRVLEEEEVLLSMIPESINHVPGARRLAPPANIQELPLQFEHASPEDIFAKFFPPVLKVKDLLAQLKQSVPVVCGGAIPKSASGEVPLPTRVKNGEE